MPSIQAAPYDQKPETRKSIFAEPRPNAWVTFAVLLASGVFLYLETFLIPNVPRLATGDQSIYLHHGVRMLQGEMIYRDYDHFTLPGTDVLYMLLFRIFGVRAWIPQAALVAVGVAILWLSIFISKKLFSGMKIYLPGLLFLTLPFTGYLDASHHWYSTLAGTGALAAVIEKRSVTRLMWSGALWGLATFFTQSAALGAVGMAVFLLWERYHQQESWASLAGKEAGLLGSLLATTVAFNVYFIWKVGLNRIFYYTVVFVVRYYPADPFNNLNAYMTGRPSTHIRANWPDLVAFPFIHLVVPLIYFLFFARYWRKSRLQPQEPWEKLMLISVTGFFLFASIAPAPAYSRLYVVSLPAILLLVWFVNVPGKTERILLRTLWSTALALAILKPVVTQTRWRAILDLPTGRTAALSPVLYEKLQWASDETRPGDYFFGDQLVCFALQLRNPARVPFLRPTDYTRPEEVHDSVQGLEAYPVQFVSWYAGLDNPVEPAGDHLGEMRRYLGAHYHVAKTFSNLDKILERNQ
jgi:hypothetical protein